MSTDNKGISDSTQDRITKVPDGLSRGETQRGSGKKEKDPKKVAAGKALAEKNKRAREALRREEEREAAGQRQDEKDQGESTAGQRPDGSSWTPEISFSNVLTVIGIGLTIVSFYKEYKNQKHKVISEPQSFSGEERNPELGEARTSKSLQRCSTAVKPSRNKMSME